MTPRKLPQRISRVNRVIMGIISNSMSLCVSIAPSKVRAHSTLFSLKMSTKLFRIWKWNAGVSIRRRCFHSSPVCNSLNYSFALRITMCLSILFAKPASTPMLSPICSLIGSHSLGTGPMIWHDKMGCLKVVNKVWEHELHRQTVFKFLSYTCNSSGDPIITYG